VADEHHIRRCAGIRCQECGREDDYEERGWKAYIADVDQIVILCPQCSEREFGDG
jgi:hypothetical protein